MSAGARTTARRVDFPPPPIERVAIVGLGLIGGSLARDLCAAGIRVDGYDSDRHTLDAAVDEGVVLDRFDGDPEALADIDALVIATPPGAASAALARLLPLPSGLRLITDTGGVKRGIATESEALGIAGRFVGSHPMTGDHRSGWGASRTGLFRGARIYLCPTNSGPTPALAVAQSLWERVGATIEVLDATAHDSRMAWTSHLPHVASSALGRILAATGSARDTLGPGGRDMTRLAGSNPRLWTDIALMNAGGLCIALDRLGVELDEFRSALARGDEPAVRRFFEEAEAWHRRAEG